MLEKRHVLEVLRSTKEAFRKKDNLKLKELSNQTLHSASIEQDPESVAIAVIVYSLSKLVEREKFYGYPGWEKFNKELINWIDESIASLEKNDLKSFEKSVDEITDTIENMSGKLKTYIQDVFRKAQINKASRIYEHGVSMERTASLLGITMFELAQYAGQTGIADAKENETIEVKKRIKLAMEMFS